MFKAAGDFILGRNIDQMSESNTVEKMIQVIIRADGNPQIGFGHLVRTRALASQLQAMGAEVVFLSKNPENISGYKTVQMPEHMNYEQDVDYLLNTSCKLGARLLIVDSYAVDQVGLDRIGALNACSVYIDDLNLYEFNVNFVINGNFYASHLDYRGNAQFLLGSDYLLMREEFKNVSYHFNKSPKNIMITFGAADAECITTKIIEIIKNYDKFSELEWHAVIGPANIHAEGIISYSKQYNNIHLHTDPNMKAIMEKCDICISASGSTVYELAACGVPAILLVSADNQIMLAEEAARIGLALNLGWHNTISKRLLLDSLDGILNDYPRREFMAILGQRMIDGYGAKRVAEILLKNW